MGYRALVCEKKWSVSCIYMLLPVAEVYWICRHCIDLQAEIITEKRNQS